jgi:hypothetical protein
MERRPLANTTCTWLFDAHGGHLDNISLYNVPIGPSMAPSPRPSCLASLLVSKHVTLTLTLLTHLDLEDGGRMYLSYVGSTVCMYTMDRLKFRSNISSTCLQYCGVLSCDTVQAIANIPCSLQMLVASHQTTYYYTPVVKLFIN